MLAQRLRRTAIAMFKGWVVCNVITFLVFAIWILFAEGCDAIMHFVNGLIYLLLYTMMACAYSAVVVLIAWLVVLFPVDLLVSESSFLRRPFPAAVCGACGGFLSVLAIWVLQLPAAPQHEVDMAWLVAFGGLAAITGLTASRQLASKAAKPASGCG